ncbi:MAG: sulfite exporter TauE/SafE family protein [Nitrososphaerota archaeon]|jgi:uncharacterized membrane protein YfcA|nr:sulfite exporter TauE/SafE family protein [Nitrososphaerota archaeon]MDG6930279.1 sulfite exporter TauE/SafE family protein [Nitrososphaerota archaeon]MDG6932976.1 sulfite exporter TauE/SafE family protein [Nitrososphaerota archaeon]MDG6935708.1 sulfite exporter TauE/SafE family protein [Nitrososphaerota archaeon]MDG6943554.1 sulfite exporter TauE/SafE family protein [Nitrososphaerota archaeon]
MPVRIAMLLALLILLFMTALAIGIVGNIAGIGGGVLLMLIFLFIMGLNPVLAGGLSLITIISSTLAGSMLNREQGAIDRRLFFNISAMAGTGAVLGSVASYFIVLSAFKLYFGFTVLGLGLFSFISTRYELKRNYASKHLNETFAESGKGSMPIFKSHRSLAAVSFVAGIISGMFGVGIGAVVGTFLASIKHVHPKVAFSTIVASMIITSSIGAVTHLSRPGIPFSGMLILVPLVGGAATGGLAGASISNRMSFASLRSSQSYIIMFFGALSIVVSLLAK